MEAGVTTQCDNQFVLLDQICMRKIPTATRGEDEGQRARNAERSTKASLILPKVPNLLLSNLNLVPANLQPLILLLSLDFQFSSLYLLSYVPLCLLNLQLLEHPAAFVLLG